VLQYAGTGQLPLFGDVADEDQSDPVVLRDPQKLGGRVADLSDRPRGRPYLRRPERLHRIDHADRGLELLQRGGHEIGLRLGEEAQPAVLTPQAHAPQLDLGGRFFPGDEQGRHRAGLHVEQSLQQKGALAHSGLSTDQHERPRY